MGVVVLCQNYIAVRYYSGLIKNEGKNHKFLNESLANCKLHTTYCTYMVLHELKRDF